MHIDITRVRDSGKGRGWGGGGGGGGGEGCDGPPKPGYTNNYSAQATLKASFTLQLINSDEKSTPPPFNANTASYS